MNAKTFTSVEIPENVVTSLNVLSLDHIWGLDNLENHHRDPFDRILISQSIAEDIPIVSDDRLFDQYPVRRLW
jgi:PIN domain nuclease of toxin-antitoxin system